MHPYSHHLADAIVAERRASAEERARRFHLMHRPRPRPVRPVFRPRPPSRGQVPERSIHLGTVGASN